MRRLAIYRGCIFSLLPFFQSVGQQISTAAPISINNLVVWTRDDALAGANPWTRIQAKYPRGKSGALYGDGLIWGGVVNEGSMKQIRVGGFEYVTGLVRGRIVSAGRPEDPADPSVRLYRIRRDYASADLRMDAAEILGKKFGDLTRNDVDLVRGQYAKDWQEWPVSKGAPFYDLNRNGARDAGEDPGLQNADMVVWFVANDLDSNITTNFYGSPPMGIEVQVTWWAYKGTMGPLGNSVFMRYVLIYKGTSQSTDSSRIDSMYIAKWTDPDIGNSGDDLSGCDTTMDLGFSFNGDFEDMESAKYRIVPPAVSYVLLQGPIIPSTVSTGYFNFEKRQRIQNLRMTSFVAHASGLGASDPRPRSSYQTSLKVNNWIRGYAPLVELAPYLDNRSEPTRFLFSGDPIQRTGWYAGKPPGYASDTRYLLGSGSFSMVRGDTQVVMYALVANTGKDYLTSISAVKFYVNLIANTYQTPEYLLSFSGGDAEDPSDNGLIPSEYVLKQNFPNPFNPSTQINYSLPVDQEIRMVVYNLLGKEIKVLDSGQKFAGDHSIMWDGRDGQGAIMPTGVYFCRLQLHHNQITRKLLLIR